MIATKVGGDPAFRSAHQPIRVAGSVHAKSGNRRLVEILHHDPRDRDLGELIEATIAMPPLEGEATSDLDFNDASAAGGSVTELFGRKVREGGVDGTTRFDALSRVIGYWIRRCREGHVTPAQAWDEIVAYNAARIDPPWPEARLAQEAERLWKRDADRNGDLIDGDGESPSRRRRRRAGSRPLHRGSPRCDLRRASRRDLALRRGLGTVAHLVGHRLAARGYPAGFRSRAARLPGGGVARVVAVATQVVVFPILGLQASLRQNLKLVLVFTGVSIVRSYLLRRLFERGVTAADPVNPPGPDAS